MAEIVPKVSNTVWLILDSQSRPGTAVFSGQGEARWHQRFLCQRKTDSWCFSG